MTVDHELQATQRLTEAEDIFRVIKSLELNRSFITVTLPQIKGVAASLVLGADLDQRSFVIDQLNEPLLHNKLHTGATLVFRAAYGGVQVSGEARVVTVDHNDQGGTISLAFPEKVLHRQRRAAYRALITAAPVPITLANNNREAIEGEITDVSAEGLGVVFPKFVHPPIEPGEFFETVQFEANGQLWNIALTAKHPNYDKMNDKYRCGFSFHQLNLAEEKAVNQWVINLQRQQRKNHRLGHPRP